MGKRMKTIFVVVLQGIILWQLFKVHRKNKDNQKLSVKHWELYQLMVQWFIAKSEKKLISDYLMKRGYQRIAIYGMKDLGEILYDELKDTNIDVRYGIDKNSENIWSEINVVHPYSLSDDEIDAIIVTPFFDFYNIDRNLEEKVNCPIISLANIIYGL